jgi:hypothetical protein
VFHDAHGSIYVIAVTKGVGKRLEDDRYAAFSSPKPKM